MSPREVQDEHRAISNLLGHNAAVTFLQKEHAAVLHTVLANTFTVGRETIQAEQFEAEVTKILGSLRAGGYAVPAGEVREICRRWVDPGRWLYLDKTNEGEVYSRTAETHEAIAYVRELSAPRRGTAARGIGDFLGKIEDLASKLSGDTEQRKLLLQRRIAEIQDELSLLEEDIGGGSTLDEFVADHDQIVEMLSAIGLAFRHVTDRFGRVQRRMLDDIALSGPEPIAKMGVGQDAWQELASKPEGAAVEDALRILQQQSSRAELTRHIHQILDHDHAQTLTARERRTFGDLATVLHSHIHPLVEESRRGGVEVNIAFRKQAARGAQSGGLDEAIRRARIALRDYGRRRLPDGLLPRLPKVTIGSVPARLPEVRPFSEPVSLSDLPASEAEPPSSQDVERWAGPHSREIAAYIESELAALEPGESTTLARLWDRSPEHLRRAVELEGYFAFAHDLHAIKEGARSVHRTRPGPDGELTETVSTLAPDRSLVRFQIPLIELYGPHQAAPTSEENSNA